MYEDSELVSKGRFQNEATVVDSIQLAGDVSMSNQIKSSGSTSVTVKWNKWPI